MLALGATFYVRRRIGTQRWRSAHRWLPALLAARRGATACSSAPTRRRRGRWPRSRRPWPRPRRWWRRGWTGQVAAAAALIARGPRRPVAREMPDTAVVWFRRDLRVARPARARARLPRARARRAALRLRSQAAAAGASAPTPAPRGCSSASRRSTASCAPAAGGWSCATGARRPRCAASRPRSARATVHVSDDVTGFARARDARVEQALGRDGVALVRHPGLYVADLPAIRTRPAAPTRSTRPSCARGRRRSAARSERAPARDRAWRAIAAGGLPSLRALGFDGRAPHLEDPPEPGEDAARRARAHWVEGQGLARYARAPRRPGRADLAPVGLPALRLPVAAAARARRGRPGLRALPRPARLARLLRRRAAALPAHRARRVPGALPRPRVGRRRRAARRLARGPDRLPRRRRRRCASSPRPAGCTTARA